MKKKRIPLSERIETFVWEASSYANTYSNNDVDNNRLFLRYLSREIKLLIANNYRRK